MKLNADYLGIFSSLLCLVHCLAIPFLWLGKNIYANQLETASLSLGWGFNIWDYIFGILALWAVYQTIRHTNKLFIKLGLTLAYCLFLGGLILHEPHELMYAGSFSLILFHSLNLFFCRKVCAV